jgi:hypothetical protein
MSTRVFTRGVRRPVREVNHSPQSGVELKNEWSYKSTPLHVRGVDRKKRYVRGF